MHYCTTFWIPHEHTAKKVSQIRTLKIVTPIEHLKVLVFCLHTPSVPHFNTTWILNTSGTLGVCKRNTFRCSISVTIFSVLIWNIFCSAEWPHSQWILILMCDRLNSSPSIEILRFSKGIPYNENPMPSLLYRAKTSNVRTSLRYYHFVLCEDIQSHESLHFFNFRIVWRHQIPVIGKSTLLSVFYCAKTSNGRKVYMVTTVFFH